MILVDRRWKAAYYSNFIFLSCIRETSKQEHLGYRLLHYFIRKPVFVSVLTKAHCDTDPVYTGFYYAKQSLTQRKGI